MPISSAPAGCRRSPACLSGLAVLTLALGFGAALLVPGEALAQSNPQLDLRPRIVPPGQKTPRTGSEFGTDWANPRNVWRAPPGYRDPSGIATDRGCVDVGPGVPTPRGRKRCR